MTTHLEADPARIAKLAAARHDEFAVLRHTVKLSDDELSDAQLDALVDEIAAPVSAAIDCTQCANCCRALDVYLTPTDAERLAAGLGVPVAQVVAAHVEQEAAAPVGEWGRLRGRPCTFLDGKLCNVYAHRPQTCRAYPALTPNFRWMTLQIIAGASVCPIIYHVLDRLIPALDEIIRAG